jgi:photosystem II stability/assembly factor-like uncharacterized protein
MQVRFPLHRRSFLGASLAVGILLPERSMALTGNAALDTASVPVKDTAGVFLVSIARAGARLVAVGEHGVIVYSDDFGTHWVQADVPVNVTLTCVSFATPLLGWAAGHSGVVLHTGDGGKTWQMQLNGIQLGPLTLAAAQAAQTQSSDSPAIAGALRRAGIVAASGPYCPFLCMQIFSPLKIMVFGAYRMAVLTTDGGSTWIDRSLDIYDRLSHDLYDTAAIGPAIYIAAETGLIFRSTDGGATFPQVASPFNATAFGVVGAQDGSIITFGVAGNAARSTDGGQSWTAINLGVQDDLIAGHVLRSGAIIIARESGGVFVSRDSGVTFTLVSALPPMFVSDFVQASDTELVFAGGGGTTPVPLALLNA